MKQDVTTVFLLGVMFRSEIPGRKNTRACCAAQKCAGLWRAISDTIFGESFGVMPTFSGGVGCISAGQNFEFLEAV